MGATERAERWAEGRNGGRLKVGTVTTGPKKATILVRNSVTEALRDPRGGSGKEFWIKLKTGSADDRRTFANVCSRLVPIEVQGGIDSTLTVRVQTYALSGEREITLAPAQLEPPSPNEMESENDQPTASPTVERGAT